APAALPPRLPRRSLAEIPSVYEVDLNPAVIILGSGHGLVVDRSRVGPRLGPDPVGGHAAAAQFGGHGFGPLLRQAVIQLAMRAGLHVGGAAGGKAQDGNAALPDALVILSHPPDQVAVVAAEAGFAVAEAHDGQQGALAGQARGCHATGS